MVGTKATRIATMGKQFRSAIEGLKSFERWQEGALDFLVSHNPTEPWNTTDT